jgi:F0F1-type ATP synthase alpha subunit
VEDARDYETELYKFLDTRRAQLLSSLSEKKQIDDAIKGELTQTLEEFGNTFAASRKTAAA